MCVNVQLAKYKWNISYLQILKKSCVEIFNVEPSSVCVNGTRLKVVVVGVLTYSELILEIELECSVSESFNVVVRGRGFTQGQSSEGVVCTISVNQQEAYSKLLHTSGTKDLKINK